MNNSKSWRSSMEGLMFSLPALLLILVFFFIPVLIIFIISITDMSSHTGFQNWHWVGLDNYNRVMHSPRAFNRLMITIKYVAVTLIFFNVGMSLLVAIFTTQIPKKAGNIFRAIWLLPRITPTVVYVMMWVFLEANAPYGVFNQLFLEPLGIQPQYWVAAMPFLSIVLVNGYIGASFGMLIFTSAIESIPKDFIHAAMVDGAGLWYQIRYIILPNLRWPLLFVTTYQTLSLLTSFEQILVLTDGAYNTEVWALWAYHSALINYWGNFQWGFGAALAGILVFLGIIFAIVYMKFFKFDSLVQEPKIEAL